MIDRKEGPALNMPESINLTEADILEAMKKIPGYLDITPLDFKEIYTLAFREAVVRLSQEVFAAEIMTRDVVVVKEETPLAEVAAAMGARGITGVPVVDENGRVTGVISEKDFLARMSVTGNQNFMTLVATCLTAKGCVALPIKKQMAKDLMTSPAITVQESATLKEIAALLTARKVNRVPVVDGAGNLIGIVSRGDLVHASFREERV
jgi:CBS domain-containing membrane protein